MDVCIYVCMHVCRGGCKLHACAYVCTNINYESWTIVCSTWIVMSIDVYMPCLSCSKPWKTSAFRTLLKDALKINWCEPSATKLSLDQQALQGVVGVHHKYKHKQFVFGVHFDTFALTISISMRATPLSHAGVRQWSSFPLELIATHLRPRHPRDAC